MRNTLFILFAGLLLALNACKHEPELFPIPTDPNDTTGTGNVNGNGNPNPTVDTICFESDILPIFQLRCAINGCHNAATAEEGFVFDSFSNIMNSEDGDAITPGNANDGEVMEVITDDDPDKRMPPPPMPALSQQQIDMIARWINEGAINSVNCAPACDTSSYTYNARVRPILQNCTSCHGGSAPQGGINLTTHAGVQAVAVNGRLMGALDHLQGYHPMPQNGAMLSFCDRTVIRKWINAGALNN